jgi:hypothetical protein
MANQPTSLGPNNWTIVPISRRSNTIQIDEKAEGIIEEMDNRAETMEWFESRAKRRGENESVSEYETRVLAELKQILTENPGILITTSYPGAEHPGDYALFAKKQNDLKTIMAGWRFREVPKNLDLAMYPVLCDSPYCTSEVPLILVIAEGTRKITPKGIIDLLGAKFLATGLLVLMHRMLRKSDPANMGITARALMRTVFGKGQSHECSEEIDLLNNELFSLIEAIQASSGSDVIARKRMLDALVSELQKRPDLLKIPISNQMAQRLERYDPCLSGPKPMPLAGVFLAGLSCVCKNRWPSLELDNRDVGYLCDGFSREDPMGQVLRQVLETPSSKIMDDLQEWRKQFDDGGMLESRFAYLRAAQGLFGGRTDLEEEPVL